MPHTHIPASGATTWRAVSPDGDVTPHRHRPMVWFGQRVRGATPGLWGLRARSMAEVEPVVARMANNAIHSAFRGTCAPVV